MRSSFGSEVGMALGWVCVHSKLQMVSRDWLRGLQMVEELPLSIFNIEEIFHRGIRDEV